MAGMGNPQLQPFEPAEVWYRHGVPTSGGIDTMDHTPRAVPPVNVSEASNPG